MLPKLYRTAPVARVGVTPPPAASPHLVLAQVKPVWPAPTPLQSQLPVDERAVRVLPPVKTNPGRVVSENIFGGPVTEGDPDVVTVNDSPYRDKVVPQQSALEPTDGWIDVFGQRHGEPVPSHGRARFGRGTFGVPQQFGALDTSCPGWLGGKPPTTDDVEVFRRAGKDCNNKAHRNEFLLGFVAWGKPRLDAGIAIMQADRPDRDAVMYGTLVLKGEALPPAGWKLSTPMPVSPPPAPPPTTSLRPPPSDRELRSGSADSGASTGTTSGGMSTTTKALIGVGVLAAIGGGIFLMKRNK